MPITGSDAALMSAYLGTMRLGASRLGYYPPTTLVKVNGTLRQGLFDDLTWSVRLNSGDQPNTAEIDLFGFTPAEGDELTIGCGSIANGLLFAGTITNVDRQFFRLNEGRPVYHCRAVSWQYEFDRLLVTKKWQSMDGAEIVTDLVETYTTGFTLSIQPAMGQIDEFSATDEEPSSVLMRLMKRLGGTFVIDDDKIVRAWISTSPNTPIDPATVTNAQGAQGNKMVRSLRYIRDEEKVKNRIIVEGGGSNLAVPAAVGDTSLRVEAIDYYSADGGTVRVDNELVDYTGIDEGGTGAIVGSGNAPTDAPTAVKAGGTNLTAEATYKYAVSYITASGETVPGPMVTFVAGTGTLAAPTTAPSYRDTNAGTGQLTNGGTYRLKATFVLRGGQETTAGPASGAFVVDGHDWEASLQQAGAFTSDPAVIWANIYATQNGGSTYYQAAQVGSETDWDTFTITSDANLPLYPQPPGTNQATLQGCYLTNIPVSPSPSVTQRKIYRTTANGSQLKLLTTLANNSTTAYLDDTADGSLGANAPTSDTSGLADNRQVAAGSTELPVSSTTPFDSGGGWVKVGSLNVQYTGVSGSNLTGIPDSGEGSLSSTVRYGTQVLRFPELTGIAASGDGSVTHTVPAGTPVNIRITREDLTSQATFDVRELVVKDNRLTQTSCELRGDAELLVAKDVLEQVTGISSDPNVKPSRMFTVNVAEWGLSSVSLRIQNVEIRREQASAPGSGPYPWPQRRLVATSQRRSLYDVLRALKEARTA